MSETKSPTKKSPVKDSKSRSRSSSRSHSSSSRSGSSSRSRSRSSSGSRSPSRRRSRSDSRSPRRKSRSPARKKERSPSPLPTKLHVGNLTRNVNEEHLKEIFGNWGKLKRVELVWDRKTQQSKGFAYLEFETNEEAVEAMARMDGAQIDGNVISVQYTLPRAKRSPRPWAARRDSFRGRGGFRFRRGRSPPGARRYGRGGYGGGGRRWSPRRGRSRSRSPVRRRRSPSRSRSASPEGRRRRASPSRSRSPSRRRRGSRSSSSRSRSPSKK